MKNKIRLLMTLLLLAVMGNAWAKEVTFSPSDFSGQGTTGTGSTISATVDGVTFSCDKGYGTTQIRCYKDGEITISSPSSTITKIEFTFSGSFTGGLSTSYTDLSTTSWSKSLSSQARFTKIVVTLEESSTPSISADGVTLAYDATSGEIIYSITNPVEGASVSASSSDNWISNVTVNSSESKVTFGVTTNETSSEREGTITLSYVNGSETLATKDVTITQGCPPGPDYVTLPFEWEGGSSSALTDINGVTASGLGGDYTNNNAPYLVKLDGTGDYIQFKTNEKPVQVTIGVKMIGGNSTSKITVQASSDGETFRDIEDLVISGAQNSTLELITNETFDDADRYVRLVFTKGSNVGVGPISILKYTEPEMPDVSFEQENATVKVGKTFVNPITKPGSLTVTYSVTEGIEYASVDESTGVVTGIAAGVATITASWTGGASYLAGSVSYTIEVIESVEEIFTRIESEDELYDGLEILIVNQEYDKAMGVEKTNNFGSVEVILNNGTATVPADDATTLILKGEPGAWYFMTPEGKYLYAASSSSNYLKTTATPDENAKATISFDEFDKSAEIIFQGDYTHNMIRFNYNNGSPLFSCYSGGQRPVHIYANTTLEKVVLNTDGYKSYVTRNAIDWGSTTRVQKNVHGYTVTEFTKTSVTLVELSQGDVTIAETPLIIQGKAGKNSLVIASGDGEDYSSGNLLKRGYDRDQNEVDYMFVLQKSKNWSKDDPYNGYNFYRLNPTRFDDIGDRQAFLVLPESERDGQASTATMVIIHATDEEPLSEDAGVLDGINSIERNDVLNGEFYTISGQRVTAPKKGLYIVNGKKVLVK